MVVETKLMSCHLSYHTQTGTYIQATLTHKQKPNTGNNKTQATTKTQHTTKTQTTQQHRHQQTIINIAVRTLSLQERNECIGYLQSNQECLYL